MRALIARRVDEEAVALLRDHFEVEYVDQNQPLAPEILAQRLPACDAVLSSITERFSAELLRRARPRLQVVSNMAAGLDNIDLEAARALGIQVFNTPAATVDATADMTLALVLALVRQLFPARRYIEGGEWRGWDPEIFRGRTLRGLVWGLLGFGRIGQATARRAHAFGVELAYHDPEIGLESLEGIPVRRVGLDELLERSDILSVHVPLTEATRGLIDGRALGRMKRTAFLANVARGPVVVSRDLVEALRSGRIAGAALDVFDPEPVAPESDILRLQNVVIAPHIGTATEECRRDMAVQAARNIVDHLVGRSSR